MKMDPEVKRQREVLRGIRDHCYGMASVIESVLSKGPKEHRADILPDWLDHCGDIIQRKVEEMKKPAE